MKVKRHGLSIGIERSGEHGNEFFLSMKIQGRLTHQDYETITPLIDSALQGVSAPKIKAFVDVIELEGWEARAAWDDLKLGLKHGSEFEKIAIAGNRKWQEVAAKIGSWFISGDIKYFENELDAWGWLDSK